MSINRRQFLKFAGLGAASLTIPACKTSPFSSVDEKPNIIFIYIDDLGYADVGYNGADYYETPNIDKLAEQGMIFTNAYANAPNCAPSRACLMTGQYTPRHGVYTVGSSKRGSSEFRKLIPTRNQKGLRPHTNILPKPLKNAGYTTACIGKWHLGNAPGQEPADQGFDVAIANRFPQSYFSPYRIKGFEDGPSGEYITDRLTQEALKFIQKHKAKPFFLYLSHFAIHSPWQAKPELVEKYRKKPVVNGHNNPTYAAMIESMDQSVGRVMDKLDQLDLAENTLLVFFSDNGGVGVITSHGPLKGAKGTLYEGGIRVPLAARWPKKIKPATTCKTPVIGLDFYPTFVELAGAKKTQNHTIDGKSLVPLLTETGNFDERPLFWHFPAYLQSWPTVHVPWRTTPVGVIRKGKWKLMEFFEDGHLELYNLEKDIGEKNNLASKMPKKANHLHQIMLRWRKNVDAPVPAKLNPEYNPQKQYKTKGKQLQAGGRRLPPFKNAEEITKLRLKRGW